MTDVLDSPYYIAHTTGGNFEVVVRVPDPVTGVVAPVYLAVGFDLCDLVCARIDRALAHACRGERERRQFVQPWSPRSEVRAVAIERGHALRLALLFRMLRVDHAHHVAWWVACLDAMPLEVVAYWVAETTSGPRREPAVRALQLLLGAEPVPETP